MRCDSCPNEVPASDTFYTRHNHEYYELHVFSNHPAADAERIIADYYERFPDREDTVRYRVVRNPLFKEED